MKPKASPTISIGMADAQQIDWSEHSTNKTWTGVLLGTLAGAVATGMFVSSSESEGPVIIVGLVFVPVGAGIGALMGSGVYAHEWQRVWRRDGGK